MSNPIRIALVSEGPTDRVVIECALRAMLPTRPFVLTQLQPEGSLAFGGLGGGWGGVYRWCKQSARRGDGHLSTDQLLQLEFELLIIHLDADVAGMSYDEVNVAPDADDLALPCERPCPPAADTANELQRVMLSWCGENEFSDRFISCVPSKNTETWVVAMLFPSDSAVTGANFECHANPAARLGQQRKRDRIKKAQRDYQDRSLQLRTEWSRISGVAGLSEARRFRNDVLASVGEL